jgi:hypothetical protein
LDALQVKAEPAMAAIEAMQRAIAAEDAAKITRGRTDCTEGDALELEALVTQTEMRIALERAGVNPGKFGEVL